MNYNRCKSIDATSLGNIGVRQRAQFPGTFLDEATRALTQIVPLYGVEGPPDWRIHRLSGDRAGTWNISASGNWRITFDIEDGAIANLNLGDCH